MAEEIKMPSPPASVSFPSLQRFSGAVEQEDSFFTEQLPVLKLMGISTICGSRSLPLFSDQTFVPFFGLVELVPAFE
jgi:hypothetical protein